MIPCTASAKQILIPGNKNRFFLEMKKKKMWLHNFLDTHTAVSVLWSSQRSSFRFRRIWEVKPRFTTDAEMSRGHGWYGRMRRKRHRRVKLQKRLSDFAGFIQKDALGSISILQSHSRGTENKFWNDKAHVKNVTLTEMCVGRSFLGCLNYILSFISNLWRRHCVG